MYAAALICPCCYTTSPPMHPCLPQTFDNGVICASEQSIVVVDEVGLSACMWLTLGWFAACCL